MLEVDLGWNNNVRRFWGLIDSGADQIVMNCQVAELLGIDWRKGKESNVMGVSGERTTCHMGKINLKIVNFNEAITVPVLFTEANVPVLLGQEGFFDKYRIKFEKDHDVFEIVKAP